jgi:hypothetical protein
MYEWHVTVEGQTKTWTDGHFDYALMDFLSRIFTGQTGTIERVKVDF